MTEDVLVVGAGFAGATFARVLAEAGWHVTVVDKRPHVGGNAYDCIVTGGDRIHQYGPHLFHTSNPRVVRWVERFGRWEPYEHRVLAALGPGEFVPLPINRTTIEKVFDIKFESDQAMRDFLATQTVQGGEIRSAEDALLASVGSILMNLFFRPYTEKMWGVELAELAPSIVGRLRLRFDREDRYFPDDAFQCLPAAGYAGLFDAILSHDRITTQLETSFDPAFRKDFEHTFCSAPIDEVFGHRFGELPYRSIRFHHENASRASVAQQPAAVVNFTDRGPFTRRTHWAKFPLHAGFEETAVATLEEPCDYRDNNYERYYPVHRADDAVAAVHAQYADLAREDPTITFIGRCGTYQYLNMDQVINQSLQGAEKWLAQRGGRSIPVAASEAGTG
jgi:UDP-galactopyranose mutase